MYTYRNFFISIILVLITSIAFAQNDPCKSYPMSGYTGDCEISTLISTDGNYVYTSDMVTLKKWDMASNKVISEISPFPYKLLASTNFSGLIKVGQENANLIYDLEIKDRVNMERPITGEAAQKTVTKLKKNGYVSIYKGNDQVAALYNSKILYRLETTTGKLTEIISDVLEPIAISGTTLLVTGGYIIDFATTKKVQFSPEQFYEAILSPDQKNVVTMGYDRQALFHDRTTGKKVFDAGWGVVRFKSDGTGFFLIHTKDEESGRIEKVTEYSYPGFQELKVIQGGWLVDMWSRNLRVWLDPDKRLIYRQLHTGKVKKSVYAYSIETGKIVDSVSFQHNPNAAEADVESQERIAREKIGNNAIEKLLDLRIPPVVHSLKANLNSQLSAYTDDGLLLLYDRYHQGQVCVLWSFPEGKPVQVYSDEITQQNGAPGDAIVVPGQIRRSFLSPSGKQIGFNSYNNAYVYEGSSQKLKLENSEIALLLEKRALAWSLNSKGERKSLSLLDTETGKVLQDLKSDGQDVTSDAHIASGKVFLLDFGKIGVWDVASPNEIKFYTGSDIAKSGFPQFNADASKTDLKPTDRRNSDLSKAQSNFLINYYWGEGFVVYDFITKKRLTEKTLYSGWTKLDNVVYFKKLDKLLAIIEKPLFTWPKPKPDAPGASAYTIDLKTNEITPYLLTDTRVEYIKIKGDPENYVFTYYPPETACERMMRKFKVGQYLVGGDGPYLVVGYDCERNVYVMAKRQILFPNSNTKDVFASRLVPVTEDQVKECRWVDINYQICPQCSGYPAGSRTEYYSGWSEWEQKSLNIHVYTRKWETTKKSVLELCNVCHGQAWVK